MLLTSQWFSLLKSSFRGRAGRQANRGGRTRRNRRGNVLNRTVAAERLEPRTLLTQSAVRVALNVSAEQSVVGDAVTYTATVRPADGSSGSPKGIATFFDLGPVGWIVVGADTGYPAQVDLLDQTGTRLLTLPQTFGSLFVGGVRVALGDLTGDGVAEVITAPGPGMAPIVTIYEIAEGASGMFATQTLSFPAGDLGDLSGLQIATGDVTGDGLADVVALQGLTVRVFSGADLIGIVQPTLQPFLTIPLLGTSSETDSIATGDVNEDGHADILVGSGRGPVSSIKVFSGANGASLFNITPFEAAFRGGVSVATGDFNGDGHLEIVAAKGVGGALVKFFDRTGATLAAGSLSEAPLQGGLQIATTDFDGNGRDDLVISTVLGTIGQRSTAQDYVPTAEFVFPGVSPIRAVAHLLRSTRNEIGGGVTTAFRAGNFAATTSVFNHYLGELPLVNKGDAEFTISTLTPGAHLVYVRYSGDPSYLGGDSKLVVNQVQGLFDFGDAPDTYGTSLFANGARHGAGGPKLGSSVDLETDGHPSADALGDDTAGPSSDDEDGVTFMSNVMFSNDQSLTNTVTVNASSAGTLSMFIDFNRNGVFDEPGFHFPVIAGNNEIRFTVPRGSAAVQVGGGIGGGSVAGGNGGGSGATVSAGATFARFRITSTANGDLAATGAAPDGEVEDYRLTLQDVTAGSSASSPISIQLPPAGFQGNSAMPTVHEFDIFNGVMTLFDVFQGGNRVPMFQIPYDSHRRIDIMGTAGDDTLRLDLSGSDVSASDFLFDGGGEATAAGDSLEIVGGGRKFDHWNLTYTDAKDGFIELDGSRIEFKDLEPINMTTIVDHATISISGYAAHGNVPARPNVTANLFDYGRGPLLDYGGGVGYFAGYLSAAGDVNLTFFETVFFVTPRLSMTVDLGTGDDRLSIESLPGGFDRASLTIRGNGGNDAIRAVSSIGNLPLNTPVTLDGGAGDDTLVGGNRSDLLIGGNGNDRLFGGDGNDDLRGDNGRDDLYGGNGDDSLSGGGDGDSLVGDSGNDVLTLNNNGSDSGASYNIIGAIAEYAYGGDGNDVIFADGPAFVVMLQAGPVQAFVRVDGEAGDDTIYGSSSGRTEAEGGDGNDVLYGRGRDNTLTGSSGDDRIFGAFNGTSTIDGGNGNDILEGFGRLIGGNGNDRITGSSLISPDTIDGGAGDDVIFTGGGSDLVDAGSGNDVVSVISNRLESVIPGVPGLPDRPTINGGDGDDRIEGGMQGDVLNGDAGRDTINGGGGDDSIDGGDGDDRLSGDAGNDVLVGGSGRDYLDGGLGNDSLNGGTDEDTINGGVGNDFLDGEDENDSLNGGDGNDTVLGSGDDDIVLGGNGNDSVSGGDGDDRVLGQAGNDTVTAGEGVDTIDGGTGNDAISEMTLNATLTPTRLTLVNLDGDTEIETLRGIERAILSAELSPAGVTLNASAFRGSVTLIGSAFNDTITSGGGADSINGGFGNDSIISGAGNDTIDGGDGNDTIRGGDGNDTIKGGANNDSLNGGAGNDLLNGGSGNDVLEGDTDSLPASAGNDSLTGQDGDDTLRGFGGNDVLVGGNGKDSLEGGAGKDTLLGEGDNDTLVGGADGDVLAGGGGVNVFTSAVAGEINELFTFPGGRPAWIDEI